MALRSLLPHPDNFQENYLLLTQGDEFEMTSLLEILASAGYEKTQRVMVPGEFSQRGDIVDIYPLDAAQPLRLEFFGDEVDTIRAFDSETQRSHENMDQVEIYPASDFILMPWEFEQGVKN